MTTVAESSFSLFVYPFVFDAREFETRSAAIESARWPPDEVGGSAAAQPSPQVWKAARFPGADMLAFVASYLNPPEGAYATARLWLLNDELQNVYGLAGRADWKLKVPKKGGSEIPYRFGEVGKTKADFAVQLALFRVGVGFVTVRVQPETDDLDQWLDFIHFFRFVKGQRNVAIRAEKRTGFDTQTRQPTTAPFFPEPAGGLQEHAEGNGIFGDLLKAFLRTAAANSDTRPWWREVFIPEQMIPFPVIFADGVSANDDLKIAFKLRSFFHSGQGESPAPEDLVRSHPGLLPYAERQWFTFSLDGGSFVAFDAPATQFFRTDLPVHLRDQYFILFLISLHQRFLLMSLSQQVSENWLQANDTTRMDAFERIRDTLLEFMARGLFTQVMQREHHHHAYVKWQQTFQISQLYQEVLQEVREMHSYLQTRYSEKIQKLAQARQQVEKENEQAAQGRAQRLERLISTLSICIGVPTVIMGFLGINITRITSGADGLRIWSALAIVLGATALLGVPILLVIRREMRSSSQPEQKDDGEETNK